MLIFAVFFRLYLITSGFSRSYIKNMNKLTSESNRIDAKDSDVVSSGSGIPVGVNSDIRCRLTITTAEDEVWTENDGEWLSGEATVRVTVSCGHYAVVGNEGAAADGGQYEENSYNKANL